MLPAPPLSQVILDRLPSSFSPISADPNWDRRSELRESLRAAAETTRAHSKSFYWSSRALPRHKRSAAFAVYSFCRYVDDTVDNAKARDIVPGRFLAELTESLEEIEAGRSRLPFALAFAEATRQFSIDRSLYLELIRGCARDEQALRFTRFAELEFYCFQVASVVGLMMSRIFGLSDPAGARRAAELGIAMQLTNILRDIDADYRLGRVYLPSEELGEAGIGERDLAARNVSDAWRSFMKGQIARARAYYRQGELGLVYIDDDGSRFATKLMARVYAGILDEIERLDYDIFHTRAYVSTDRKLWITLKTLAD